MDDRVKRLRTADNMEAVELAYGFLWHMTIDRRLASDLLALEARRTLIKAIGKDGQERGIAAAKAWMRERNAHPYAPRERTWTWEQMMQEWPEDDRTY